jgi:hypothetical protein
MHRSQFSAGTLFAALALATAAVHATSVSSTTLSPFYITLVDLAPDDGVAPSIVLDPTSRSTVLPGAVSPGASTYWLQQGDSAFGPVSSSGDLDGSGGSASFAGDPLGAGAQLAASAVGGPSLAIGSGVAVVNSQPSGVNQFVLSAQTQVTFSGYATLDWSAGTVNDAAYGEVDIDLSQDSTSFLDMEYLTGGYYGDGVGALSGSTAGWVTATFANDSDASVEVNYYVGVFANAAELEMIPPPIDEPAGAGLLLAGASMLLWGVRRRRWGAAPPAPLQ